jgi:hypothetical protein
MQCLFCVSNIDLFSCQTIGIRFIISNLSLFVWYRKWNRTIITGDNPEVPLYVEILTIYDSVSSHCSPADDIHLQVFPRRVCLLSACGLGSFSIEAVFDPPVQRCAVCTPLHADGQLRLVRLDRLQLTPFPRQHVRTQHELVDILLAGAVRGRGSAVAGLSERGATAHRHGEECRQHNAELVGQRLPLWKRNLNHMRWADTHGGGKPASGCHRQGCSAS